MVKNYFKTAIRNLLKNALSSFINVFGLAMAIGCCIVVYAFLSFDWSVDQQHAKKDRLFMISPVVNRDGQASAYGLSPTAMGSQLQQDFPQIKRMTRIDDRSVVAKHGDNVFHEWIRLVDPDFLEMFTFPLKTGELTALQDRSQIVLSENMADKYFGEDVDPTGETINMRFDGGFKMNFTVAGVAEEFPETSSIRFDFLVNLDVLNTAEASFRSSDWGTNIRGTFIELESPDQIEAIEENQEKYLSHVNSAQTDYPVEKFNFEPLETLYKRSNEIRNDLSGESDEEAKVVLSIIGFFMITLACLNYLNIAISSATKRLKEIGVRKVIGASKRLLIAQFITENVLLSFIALVIGFFVAIFLLIPGFNTLFTVDISFDLTSYDLYIFLGGLLLLTAVASGAYPAVYISRFPAVTIFRGTVLFGRKNKLTKVFLTLQFILACITVVTATMIYLNTQYQKVRDWGYDQQNTIMVPVDDFQAFTTLRNSILNHPDVISTSGSSEHFSVNMSQSVIELPERTVEVFRMDVDDRYLETMQVKVVEGRGFREDFASDQEAVLINRKMAENLEWFDPIGKTFRFDSTNYKVIGMLKDFHYYSFWNDIEPTFMRLAEEENYRYLTVRTREGRTIPVFETMEAEWANLFPESPFDGRYQRQLYTWYWEELDGHVVLINFVAVLALMLACFGLYGLVSLNVASRVKEFSVRKVLGANIMALTNAINSHFLLYLIVAMILGGPISFYLVKLLFESVYNYHIPITVPPVMFSIGMILVTVVFTISSQILKVLKTNPTVGLRNE